MLSSFQCSSLAPVDGKRSSIHKLLWYKETPCLRSLCKTISKLPYINCYTCTSNSKIITTLMNYVTFQNGVTMLLINLDNSTTVLITPAFNNPSSQQGKRGFQYKRSKLTQVSPGDQMYNTQTREEYHLTAKDGNLHSQTMLLNGNALTLTSSGDIPMFIPVIVNSSEPITVAPYSIVFVHLPDVDLPACK